VDNSAIKFSHKSAIIE